jgi:predicted DNA binding CopG/RHH family protein
MRRIPWSIEKNRELNSDASRRICFEDIVAAIESGGLLDDIDHPNQKKYPGRRLLVILAKGYVYAVPYVETAEGMFLKTAFPSRRLKAQYLLAMKKTPGIGKYLDADEEAFIESFETSQAPLKSGLTPERRREIESMARAAMTDERAKISLRVPKGDLERLKSRALQEGIPYQTLINALIHRYVSN